MATEWCKAYDSVDLGCLRRALPVAYWGPAHGAYTASRRLRSRGFLGEAWRPAAGILPGCAVAVYLLGLLIWPWKQAVEARDHQLSARLYVDDATFRAVGEARLVAGLIPEAFWVTKAFEQDLPVETALQ